MNTFVINLKRSRDRKEYMMSQCKDFSFLDIQYIEAVDGKAMSEKERHEKFDYTQFFKKYSVAVRPGEIGCTLSHQKCYKKIMDENIPYVLILEDDVVLPKNHFEEILSLIEEQIKSNIPQVILLSGWYWYTKTNKCFGKYKFVDVYNAWQTHSYIINKAAARLLVDNKPYTLADDWYYARRKGVKLQAVLPHIVTQNRDSGIVSTVNIEQISHKSFLWRLKNIKRLVMMKVLYFLGHFEEA